MRRFFRPRPADLRAEVEAELQSHLEMQVRDLIAAGTPPEVARQEAERRFGELRAIRDACVAIDRTREERAHRKEVFGAMLRDLRFALRTLGRSPGFTLTAVLCLGLGIGVSSTIVSAVHAILVRPLPYPEPQELVSVYTRHLESGEGGINISHPDYASWRDDSRSFSALGMWTWQPMTFSGEGEPERVEGAMVTANLFPLLGVRPILGRSFVAEEDGTSPTRVVLLSHGLWRRRFGGDSTLVGKSITVEGFPYVVVGVMPPGFAFPDRGQAWMPFTVAPIGQSRANRFYAGAIGRLKPGLAREDAQRDLDVVAARLRSEFPQDNTGWGADVVSLREDLVGDLRRPLLVFLGAVGFVLLIVCANVANLMLTRGAGRQRELAVRQGLGAGRGTLVRQLLIENLVLAGLGGAVGLALAMAGVRLFGTAVPGGLPWYASLRLDGAVVLFTFGLAALSGLLFGVAPALRSADVDLSRTLRAGTGSGGSPARARLRGTLVVVEVALSLVLLIGAVLLIRSYASLQATPHGFEPRGVLTFRLSPSPNRYTSTEMLAQFYHGLFERLEALPGVEAAGSAQGIPMSGWNVKTYMSIEGQPARLPGQELDVHYQRITPGYFRAMGIPLLAGRGFLDSDRDTLNRVGIINATLARQEFQGQDPVGKRMRTGQPDAPGPWITIVGVVESFRHYGLAEPMGPAIYVPYFERPTYAQTVVVRTTRDDPMGMAPAVLGVVHGLDPDLPGYELQSMQQAVDRSLWRQRLQGQVVGLFAALALALAAIGIYGVISYAVAQRTREIGVRMALGASGRQVVRLVVREGMLLALAGIGIGLAGAFALTGVLARLLYGIRVTDPVTFVAVPLVLGSVAALACWVPARRAARVDPLLTMRAE
jgi:putative ABC transport system permease protein